MTFPSVPLAVPQWTDTEEINAAKLSDRIDIPLNQIEAFLNNAPLGIIGYAQTPSNATYTTNTLYLTLTLPFVAGRSYQVSAYFGGVNNANPGAPQVGITGPGIPTMLMWFLSTPPQTIYGTAAATFTATSTGNLTFSAYVNNLGSCTINGASWLLVEDIGK